MSPIDVFIADPVQRERCRLDLCPDHPIHLLDSAPFPGAVMVTIAHEAVGVAQLAVLLRLLASSCTGAEREILRVAGERMPAELHPVMEHVVALAPCNASVARLAAAAGVSRRTLSERLHRAGMPPAGALVGWVRALLVAYQLYTTTHPATRIAATLAFASERALRRHLHAHGAASPRAMRHSPDAFHALLDAFGEALVAVGPMSRSLSLTATAAGPALASRPMIA